MSAVNHDAIAQELMGEASGTAKDTARDLFGDVPAGTQKMTKADFLDFFRRNWEPGQQGLAFRQAQLTRMGPAAFLEAAEAAGVIGDYKEALAMIPRDNAG